MARQARIVIPDVPHHVTQRGNNRQDVFFTDDDRRLYLAVLQERCAAAGVRVLAYCLMNNHVHLIVVPPDEGSLAAAVGRTHFLYAQAINHLHGRSGHLWQGRFYSCPLDETHLWRAAAYVERNPVRSRLVRRAWKWPWSSAAVHVGAAGPDEAAKRNASRTRGAGKSRSGAGVRDGGGVRAGTKARSGTKADGGGLLDLATWRAEWTAGRWRKVLTEPTDEAWRTRFWRAAHTGRPLAEDRWLAKLEARLGRRLRANAVGRPRKVKVRPGRGAKRRGK